MGRRVSSGTVVFFCLALGATGHALARDLTFEERVNAQEAIERVYYSHQIGATKPFEKVVTRRDLEEKVRKYLQESVALELYWKTLVTDEMLQRELERMAHESGLPDRLHEIFAALNGDPFLIKECLARATLVGRLTHNFYAFDQRLHGAERRRAQDLQKKLAAKQLDIRRDHPDRWVADLVQRDPQAARKTAPDDESSPPKQGSPAQRVLSPEEYRRERARWPKAAGQVAPVAEERDAFVIRVVLGSVPGGVRAASYVVPKLSWDLWWEIAKKGLQEGQVVAVAADDGALPVAKSLRSTAAKTTESLSADSDTWNNGILDIVPDPHVSHTAVWTGSVMVIWGGHDFDYLNSGARYDPATDTWSATSTIGAPSARELHTAVWTGSAMVVWGGRDSFDQFNTGGRYDPLTDTWTAVSTDGAPSARAFHSAVWTGSAMVVWGGIAGPGVSNTGGRYDPATDTWTATSTIAAPSARSLHTAVWTGSKMLVWGGSADPGGRYDPATDTWTEISTVGAPLGRVNHTAVWTGSAMVVWGGLTGINETLNTGGRYYPATNTWMATSTVGAPSGRADHSAIWTGTEMVVWGGQDRGFFNDSGGRYDPASDTWRPTSTVSVPFARTDHTAIWTGTLMVVWGGSEGPPGGRNTGGRYDLVTDTWTPTSTGGDGAPSGRTGHTAVWTGSIMLVWGGSVFGLTLTPVTGGQYDPATDTWTGMSIVGAPHGRFWHSAVWTGSEMVVWGGYATSYLDTGGRYDPTTDTWTALSNVGAPSGRAFHTAVWTGNSMVIWGGRDDIDPLDTGGRYDPTTDTWTTTSTLEAPIARQFHTAVWTGSSMIVWGGIAHDQGFSFHPILGGRYDPSTDSWTPTSIVGAPSGRIRHTAIWTGSMMVVWGGTDRDRVWKDSGGRYDPATDSWTPTSREDNVPLARSDHTAVWSGKEMIVWGGAESSFLNSGGRYDPVADRWLPTSSAGAPSTRQGHSAIWTGRMMIVWGGSGDLNNGGRYFPIENAPPFADAGSVLTLECTGARQAMAALDGSRSTDADSTPGTNDDIVDFDWFENFGTPSQTFLGAGPHLDVNFGLGQHRLTLHVTDSIGESATAQTTVTIRDTIPPSLTLAPSSTLLWPPNHRLIPVQTAWQASDVCDASVNTVLTAVTSSESDDAPGNGDGNTSGDIQDASVGTPDSSILLRAERSGSGPGRVYTLTYAATDATGNTASAVGLAGVAHDLGMGPEPLMIYLEGIGTSGIAHVFWNAVPGADAYDLIQGDLDKVTVHNGVLWLGPVQMLASGTAMTGYTEEAAGRLPETGKVFFYLVQYRDGPNVSGWGTESAPWPEEPTSCNAGCTGDHSRRQPDRPVRH